METQREEQEDNNPAAIAESQLQRDKEAEIGSSDATGESDDEEGEEQIEIMGGPSANEQLLLIKGVPGQVYQLNGRVLCSSRAVGYGLGQGLTELLGTGLRKIEQKQIGYYIVGKKAPHTGKILILDSEVYNERFYVDWNYVLLLSLDRHEYKLKPHYQFKHLKLVEPENPEYLLLLVLQANSDRPILEKTLAEGEEMYISNAHVVVMSESVQVRRSKKSKELRLRGPGFVFVEPHTKFQMNPKLREFLLTNLLMVAFLTLITMIELWMFT